MLIWESGNESKIDEELEICANKFLEMCQNHPEICPHDYHWVGSTKDYAGAVVERYVCGLCGNTETITKIIEE